MMISIIKFDQFYLQSSMLMKLFCIVLIGVSGLFADIGCGGVKNVVASDEFDNITDEEVFEAVYSGNKYPSYITVEDLKGGSPYYISEWSLDSPYGRSGSRAPLCTQDHNQAKEWATALNDSLSYPRVLEEEKDAEKYHEFRMVNPKYSTDIVLFRVDKCSYLERAGFGGRWPMSLPDSNSVDSIGRFEVRPISTENFSELVYYLWWTSNFNMYGHCIIKSSVHKSRDNIILKMYETRYTTFDYGMYNEIYLYLTTYSVNIKTGLAELSSKKVKTIQGSYNEELYR